MNPSTIDLFQVQAHPSAELGSTDTLDPLTATAAADSDVDPTDRSSGHPQNRPSDFRDLVRGIAVVASLIVALIVLEAILPATAC